MKTIKNKILLGVAVIFSAALNIHAGYDPSIGRWASRDPAQEQSGLNLYGFVANDAIGHVDDLGLAFYAVDGTWTKASDHANPWQLIHDTTEVPRRYYRGPHLGATGLDSWGIAVTVKKQICQDFCQAMQNGSDFKINLTGWSRGAIIAAGVAQMLNDEGCDCCKTHYQPVSVNWIGLFDAVAMMPADQWWPRAVPANVAHFDHAIKTGHQRMFPTWHFTGGSEQAFDRYDGTPTLHVDIGESYKLNNNGSYNWIKGEAAAAGVAF